MMVLHSRLNRAIFQIGVAVTVLSVSMPRCADAAEPPTVWRTDFSSAWKEAKRLNRPMLVHFYADWCAPCQQMERTVLKSPKILKQLDRHFIAVKVDSDAHPDLIQHFNVRALPSDIFVDPKGSGTLLSQTEGYQSPGRYLSKVVSIGAKYQNAAKTLVAKDGGSDTSAAKTPATITPENRDKPDATQDSQLTNQEPKSVPLTERPVTIGLGGYSPVALAKSRNWSKGVSEFKHEYQGIVYHLASDDELQEFAESPGRFAPQLLGCDPVVLWKTDRAVAGSTQFGAYFDNELYLFSSEDSRKQFKVSPLQFTRTRHVLRVEQIEKTRIR